VIPYPAHLSEPEVQTRLLSCLLLLGYDARAEVRDGPSESRSGARFDIVIFLDGQARAIIEVKRDRPTYAADIETRIADRESTQRRKYLVTDLPVLVCRGRAGIPSVILQITNLMPVQEIEPMKRFTETTQWDKPWFMGLSMQYHELWKFINDKADAAGVWSVNRDLAQFYITQSTISKLQKDLHDVPSGILDRVIQTLTIEWDNLPPEFEERIVRLSKNHWLLPDFIAFQTGNTATLNLQNNVHKAIQKALDAHGLVYENKHTFRASNAHRTRIECPKDKYKDKYKEKKKGKGVGKTKGKASPIPEGRTAEEHARFLQGKF